MGGFIIGSDTLVHTVHSDTKSRFAKVVNVRFLAINVESILAH